MKYFAVLILIFLVGVSGAVEALDIRDVLENSASTWKNFPNGKHTSLTKFAYIGKIESAGGAIYVVEVKQVLTGMEAPRGRTDILFFDQDHRFIDALPEGPNWYPEPLWCESGLLYFAGRSRGLPTNTAGVSYNGNALDLRLGWRSRTMVDRAATGSANEKDLPTREERERERTNWDAK